LLGARNLTGNEKHALAGEQIGGEFRSEGTAALLQEIVVAWA